MWSQCGRRQYLKKYKTRVEPVWAVEYLEPGRYLRNVKLVVEEVSLGGQKRYNWTVRFCDQIVDSGVYATLEGARTDSYVRALLRLRAHLSLLRKKRELIVRNAPPDQSAHVCTDDDVSVPKSPAPGFYWVQKNDGSWAIVKVYHLPGLAGPLVETFGTEIEYDYSAFRAAVKRLVGPLFDPDSDAVAASETAGEKSE